MVFSLISVSVRIRLFATQLSLWDNSPYPTIFGDEENLMLNEIERNSDWLVWLKQNLYLMTDNLTFCVIFHSTKYIY